MYKLFPEERKKQNNTNQHRPCWYFMNEFVDKDGAVFLLKQRTTWLKGTLPPTKIKAKEKLNEEPKMKSCRSS